MPISAQVDGFRLAYDDHPGAGTVARSLAERTPAPEDWVTVPTTVLWSDRVGLHYADIEVRPVDGIGHFLPLEAPDALAAAILERSL